MFPLKMSPYPHGSRFPQHLRERSPVQIRLGHHYTRQHRLHMPAQLCRQSFSLCYSPTSLKKIRQGTVSLPFILSRFSLSLQRMSFLVETEIHYRKESEWIAAIVQVDEADLQAVECFGYIDEAELNSSHAVRIVENCCL